MGSALNWLIFKILKTKSRGNGACLTCQEIFTILCYGLGMGWALKALVQPSDVGMSQSPPPRTLPSSQSYLAPCGVGISTTLLFAPNTSDAQAVVSAAASLISLPDPSGLACHTEGFATTADLLAAYATSPARQQAATAAILFNGNAGTLSANYTLALSRNLVSIGEIDRRNFEWPRMDAYRAVHEGVNDGDSIWLSSGFVTVQWAVDRALVGFLGGPSNGTAHSTDETRFPLQPYKTSYGHGASILHFLLPLFGFIPSITICFLLGQFMIIEKAYQLVEGLQMMGMQYRNYYGSWLVVYGVLMLAWAVVQLMGFLAMGYFPESDLGLMFIHFLLSGLSFLPAQFYVVAIHKGGANDPEKAKQDFQGSAFFTMLLHIGLFALCHFVDLPIWSVCVLSFIPQVAALNGLALFVQAEQVGMGLGWSDLLWTKDGTMAPLLALDGLILVSFFWNFFWAVQAGKAALKKVSMPSQYKVGVAVAHGGPGTASAISSTGGEELKAVVDIRNLGRAFKAKPKPVVALSNFNLTLYEGQITTLLGQNGAGKSTAIGILNGLIPPSEGDATIYGHSISRGMDQIRGLSGICPQHDLIFEGLSCVENLQLVGSQKGMTTAALKGGAVLAMLNSVGLGPDKHAQSTATLSGGQKRKLSLACALIGDPKFVMLDEPTAGMDPASRRVVWGVMAAAKAGRAIVLTTHFLDEADALGDRVAILHLGRLQCVGTSAQLKQQNGTAFHLRIAREANGASTSELLQLTGRHVDGIVVEADQPDEVGLQLPQESAPSFAALFSDLDANVSSLGVKSYGLSIPTLQEVFLKITAEADQRRAEQDEAELAAAGKGRGRTIADSSIAAKQPAALDDESGPPAQSPNWRQQIVMGLTLKRLHTITDPMALFVFCGLPCAMIICAFLIPPLLDKAEPIVVFDPTDPGSLPLTRISMALFTPNVSLPFTPPSGTVQAQLADSSSSAVSLAASPLADASALNDTLKLATLGAVCAFDIGSGGSASPSPAVPATIFHNASLVSALPLGLHLLDSALIPGGAPLETTASLLPYVGSAPPNLPIFVGGLVTPNIVSYNLILIGLLAVITLVKDRLVEKTTHQQLVMGLSPFIRWVIEVTYFTALVWFELAIAIVVMACFPSYTPTAAAIPAFALVAFIATPSIVCFLCLFNFLFWCRKNVEDVVSQSFCNVMQLLVFYPGLLITVIPVIRDSALAKSVVTYTLLLIPLNQISMGLSSIYSVTQIAAYTAAYVPSTPPLSVGDFFKFTISVPFVAGSSPGPLTTVIYSLLTAPLWFYLLWYIDIRRYYYSKRPREVVLTERSEDPDVAVERQRAEAMDGSGALVHMAHLRKEFPAPKKKGKKQPNKVAVVDLSLAIDGAGCFALLGPNGAGKTTTLSMLTGDLRPTAGEASVGGYSVRTEIMQIFRMLGYCPQFGGLFTRGVTLKQHLQFFARLKGVPEKMLEAHCTRTMAEFGLQAHAHKWVGKLSGGTRRKLVAAIALACDPQVCFLDEPTTGVDVGTRQFLWDRINAKGARGCALILTTHYMEEADALAQRVGIMVNGELKVLGSPQHLKSVHGGGYRIEIKGPEATAKQAKSLVEGLFADTTQLESHGGFQVFEVGKGSRGSDGLFQLSPVFSKLDEAKASMGIENYTLSQTTLEQVFLNIASEQQEEVPK